VGTRRLPFDGDTVQALRNARLFEVIAHGWQTTIF
jgi:hypothetical protein